MGSFETYVYSSGSWSDRPQGPTFLSIAIHDSDIATVTYAPAPAALGLVYLGFQPRDYFGDPAESADVDLDGEAGGLAAWANEVLNHRVPADEIRPLLAAEVVEEPDDTFVEDTARRLIKVLGLPLPSDLSTGT